jgi:hypothetical protein
VHDFVLMDVRLLLRLLSLLSLPADVDCVALRLCLTLHWRLRQLLDTYRSAAATAAAVAAISKTAACGCGACGAAPLPTLSILINQLFHCLTNSILVLIVCSCCLRMWSVWRCPAAYSFNLYLSMFFTA